MMKIRMCTISLCAKHNGKAGNYVTPRGREQRHVNKLGVQYLMYGLQSSADAA